MEGLCGEGITPTGAEGSQHIAPREEGLVTLPDPNYNQSLPLPPEMPSSANTQSPQPGAPWPQRGWAPGPDLPWAAGFLV